MNKKTNIWAVKISSFPVREAILRIAASYEYTWLNTSWAGGGGACVGGYIYFNPTNKKMVAKSSAYNVEADVCKIALTIEDVMNLFINPPQVEKTPTSVKVGDHTIHADGSVYFEQGYDSVSVTKKTMDELISARNKLIGSGDKKAKLPIVEFFYKSPTSGRKLRRLMVVDEGPDYLFGLDMEDGNLFKRFNRDRIGGEIRFLGLSESKDW